MNGRGAWLEIDTERLIHNYFEVRNAVDRQAEKEGRRIKLCSVLKANCYGIGAVRVAEILETLSPPPDAYAVACASEALELRGVTDREILILGYVGAECFEAVIRNRIAIPVYRTDTAVRYAAKARELGMPGLCHIAVNSGMNRLGFLPDEENAGAVAELFRLPGLEIDGIFTHLAVADETDKTPARIQMARFTAFLDMLRACGVTLPAVHAGASPTVCDLPEYYMDMVRSGLTLPGYYASDEVSRERVKLLPAVKLKAYLGNAMPVKAGEGVGYGFTFRLTKDTVVGLVPLGCSDGVPRGLSNNFYVTVRGIRCPQIGRICMDHFMIDLADVPDPVIGEEVVVYGDGPDGPDGALGVMDVADRLGTIPDELLSIIAPRVPRVYR